MEKLNCKPLLTKQETYLQDKIDIKITNSFMPKFLHVNPVVLY